MTDHRHAAVAPCQVAPEDEDDPALSDPEVIDELHRRHRDRSLSCSDGMCGGCPRCGFP